MDDTAFILDEAKKLVEKGWTRGKSSDGRGRYCLSGAIDKALDRSGITTFERMREEPFCESRMTVYHALEQVIESYEPRPSPHWLFEGDPVGRAMNFNDRQKSKGPVLDLLTDASKKLRNPVIE